MIRTIHKFLSSELNIKDNKKISNGVYNLIGDNLSNIELVKITDELEVRGTTDFDMKAIRTFLEYWEQIPSNLKITFSTLLYIKYNGDEILYNNDLKELWCNKLRLHVLKLKYITEKKGNTINLKFKKNICL